MKTKWGIVIIILIWILVLVGIIYKHNVVIIKGKIILLKTEPVDPRDPFKGDYVNLQFDISRIRETLTSEQKTDLLRNHKIFAVLKSAKEENTDYFVLDYFTTKRPNASKVYIQGWVWGEINNWMRVQYNIESYYVPEGKGKEIESHLGKDLFVEIYLDYKGSASLKSLILDNKPYIFTSQTK